MMNSLATLLHERFPNASVQQLNQGATLIENMLNNGPDKPSFDMTDLAEAEAVGHQLADIMREQRSEPVRPTTDRAAESTQSPQHSTDQQQSNADLVEETMQSQARRQADALTDEHKDGSLWINHNDEIWAWVQNDWRMLRNSGLWSGILLYSGESQMRTAGPFTEVDFARLTTFPVDDQHTTLIQHGVHVDD